MRILISSKNLEVNESLESYVEEKVGKLDRFLSSIDETQIDLSYQQTKNANDRNVAQITMRSSNGLILRAEERSSDMRASIDSAVDKMKRQIKKYKGKHWQSKTRRQQQTPNIAQETESEGPVARVKRFRTRPMRVEEAVAQMELLGHDFFIFYNIDTEGFGLVYRRRDNGYGLLLPELE